MPAPGGLCHRFLLVPNFYDSLWWADEVCGLRKGGLFNDHKGHVHDLEWHRPFSFTIQSYKQFGFGGFRCTNLTRLHCNCIHRGLPTYNLVHWIVLEIFSCGWRLWITHNCHFKFHNRSLCTRILSKSSEELHEIVHREIKGNHQIRVYRSYIQHESPEIICSIENTFLRVDLTSKIVLKTLN